MRTPRRESKLRILLPLLFASAMLASMVVAVPVASGVLAMEWQFTNVDAQGGSACSLALDALGNPRVVYLDDQNYHLKYAIYSAGAWSVQTVDDQNTVGSGCSLALDAEGYAHISYYDWGHYSLNYATNKDGSWAITTVDGSGDVGGDTSIALDSLGHAHITYWNTTGYLGYATNEGGSWRIANIGSEGSASSIAIDSQDHAHVSYYGSDHYLHYTTNAGGGWSDEALDGPYGVGFFNAIALDSNDKVHIAYTHHDGVSSPWYLAYADNVGGSWDIQVVDDTYDNIGSNCDIAVDSQGRSHISYNGAGSGVKYADNVGGSWDYSWVDDSGYWETSIALDQNDNAFVCYRASSSYTLRCATNQQMADTQAPTVNITSPTTLPTYTTMTDTVALSGTASDNVGVTSVTWQNQANSASGVASGTSTWSIGGISLMAGDNVITVTASDAAANNGTAVITVTYTPDATNPTLLITMPNSLGYATTNQDYIIIGGQASDDNGVVSVAWSNQATGGSGAATGTTSWETGNIPLNPGINLITVTVHDSSGNTATEVFNATYTPSDTTDPTIAITSPPPGSVYETNVSTMTVTGTCSDNVGVTSVTWQNSRGGTGTATHEGAEWSTGSIQLQDGDNVITVYAHDAAGNTAYTSITVHYSPIDSGDMTYRTLEYALVGIAAVAIVLVLAFFMMKRKKKDDKKG